MFTTTSHHSVYETAIFFLLIFLMTNCTVEDTNESASSSDQIQEATSLLEKPLYRPIFFPERISELEDNLSEARSRFEENRDNLENIIWLGRRMAYLWRYQEAISIFSEGIERYPSEPRLYRHRGHRYISIRELDKAVTDLKYASELIEGTEDKIEPDGAPNASGIPTSTLHTNIWYHLGLAYYLQGNFENALYAFEQCLEAATNEDMYVATADWLYMTLRRLGRPKEAEEVLVPIHAEMDLIENFAYYRRLLMYKGEIAPDSLLRVEQNDEADLNYATQGYGVGNWYLYNGQTDAATTVFRRVLESSYWSAFGYIAAEAEIARLEKILMD